ncbi:MAG: copper chaperone PCu(A)C [Armatimonadota bacterium]|nr:copper chaperone PCu(A)C [Armatimonadota bacterium]
MMTEGVSGMRRQHNTRRWAAAGLVALSLTATWAVTVQGQTRIRVEQVWARPGLAAAAPSSSAAHGPMSGGNSAVYMILHNDGDAPDRLTDAETDVAASVELHETRVEGGMGQMFRVPSIVVPARGRVELKPGGLHIMLIGLRRDLKVGERFQVVLVLERAGRVPTTAEVRMSAP